MSIPLSIFAGVPRQVFTITTEFRNIPWKIRCLASFLIVRITSVQFHPEGLVKYADDEFATRIFSDLPAFIGFKPGE